MINMTYTPQEFVFFKCLTHLQQIWKKYKKYKKQSKIFLIQYLPKITFKFKFQFSKCFKKNQRIELIFMLNFLYLVSQKQIKLDLSRILLKIKTKSVCKIIKLKLTLKIVN